MKPYCHSGSWREDHEISEQNVQLDQLNQQAMSSSRRHTCLYKAEYGRVRHQQSCSVLYMQKYTCTYTQAPTHLASYILTWTAYRDTGKHKFIWRPFRTIFYNVSEDWTKNMKLYSVWSTSPGNSVPASQLLASARICTHVIYTNSFKHMHIYT